MENEVRKRLTALWLPASLSAFLALLSAASGQAPFEPAPVASTLLNFDTANPGDGNPKGFLTLGSNVYFLASDPAYGQELRKSDGTTAGTVLLKDVEPGPDGSRIGNLVAAGDVFYFTSGNGSDLWRSDGTEAGTVPVETIGPANPAFPKSFAELTAMNGVLYFQGNLSTPELWRSDGTAAGTTMVKDIGPGFGSPRKLAVSGSTLYFVADTPSEGAELWKSDGTEAGTMLVKDIYPGSNGGLLTTSRLVSAGGLVYFSASTAAAGYELWRSDGTAAGTILLKDLEPGNYSSYPTLITAVGNKVCFVAQTTAAGYEYWTSDGTPAGTLMLRDLKPGSDSGAVQGPTTEDQPAVLGGVMYFSGSTNGNGAELWRTDGTVPGTYLLKNIAAEIEDRVWSGSPRDFFTLGAYVYFLATGTNSVREVWRTDGTEAGTIPFRSLLQGQADDLQFSLTIDRNPAAQLGENILFAGSTPGDGIELWRMRATGGGVSKVKNFYPGRMGSAASLTGLTASGGALYFQANRAAEGLELWRAEGAGKAPVLLKDTVPGTFSGSPREITATGTETGVFFIANRELGGVELWKSDGSSQGTLLLKAFPDSPGLSPPAQLTMLGNRLLFVARTPETGRELWTSDGTPEGTVIVKDIEAGSGDSLVRSLMVAGGSAWFSAYSGGSPRLWRTDGTAAGTVSVRTFDNSVISDPAALVALGSRVFFTAASAAAGRELWRSDGAASSTVMVKDIAPGVVGSILFEQTLTVMGGKVYFWGHEDGAGGERLWSSDGSAAGTKPVWAPTSQGFPPDALRPQLTACGNLLFFQLSSAATGTELWKSDGTSDGTAIVKDIFPGPDSSAVTLLGQSHGILYFAATDDTHGQELWRSDGTEAGTFMVEDLVPGSGSSQPTSLAALPDGLVYGVEDDGSGKPALRQLIWPAMRGAVEIIQKPGPGLLLKFTGLRLRPHAVDVSLDLQHWTNLGNVDPNEDGSADFPVPVSTDLRRWFRARDIALQPAP